MTEEEDLEWEEWDPSRISFVNHMFAGSAAGLAEHLSVFPIDTLKTHIQCERCGSMSPAQTWNCAARIVGREGIFRLWRGVSATFAGCLPAHAAYFSIFESTKVLFGAHKEGHHPIQAAACGASAAFGHDLCMTPFDTVKQRMQLGYYNSVKDCVIKIGKKEGIRAFYLSLPTTLMMNIPYGCVMVAANESARKILNPKGGYNIGSSMLAGSIAGAVAAALTNPLDVIKTRLQTQNLEPCPTPNSHTPSSNTNPLDPIITKTKAPFKEGPGASNTSSSGIKIFNGYKTLANASPLTPLGESIVRKCHTLDSPSSGINELDNLQIKNIQKGLEFKVTYRSSIEVMSHIIKEEGYRGFLRGLTPRVLLHAPAVAISWTTYETMKKLLSRT